MSAFATEGAWSVGYLCPTLIIADAGEDPDHPGERLVVNVALAYPRRPDALIKNDLEAKANAALIAAAPDAVAVLSEVRLYAHRLPDDLNQRVLEALQKAGAQS